MSIYQQSRKGGWVFIKEALCHKMTMSINKIVYFKTRDVLKLEKKKTLQKIYELMA